MKELLEETFHSWSHFQLPNFFPPQPIFIFIWISIYKSVNHFSYLANIVIGLPNPKICTKNIKFKFLESISNSIEGERSLYFNSLLIWYTYQVTLELMDRI